MTTTERLCLDCERRPLPKDGSRERCRPCQQRYEAEQQDEAEQAADRKTRRKWTDPLNMCRYSTVYVWKQHLVGYTTGATDDGRTYCQPGFFYLRCDPQEKDLAKFGHRLRDMNTFQPGFPGDWVKRFKAMLKAAGTTEGARFNWDGSM